MICLTGTPVFLIITGAECKTVILNKEEMIRIFWSLALAHTDLSDPPLFTMLQSFQAV